MVNRLHVRVELRLSDNAAFAAVLPGFEADARHPPVQIPGGELGDDPRVVVRGSVGHAMLETLRRDPRVIDVYLDPEAARFPEVRANLGNVSAEAETLRLE